MALVDLRNRAPKVERLPDYRQRATYVYDIQNQIVKDPAKILADAWLPWGTAAAAYPNLRLVHQDVTGQLEGPTEEPEAKVAQLIRVYEEIPATAEVQVGNPAVTVNQYGYKEVAIDYLQFSVGTAIFQVPGTTAAPAPFETCILRDQVATDDGTLRRIKRTYVAGGQLDQFEELKFGGKLLLRTLKYLNQVPPTPSGFTLVTKTIEYINGLPIYSYGFAAPGNGSGGVGSGGVISEKIDYNMSVDEGVHGATVYTITYISDLSVVANPITPPADTVLISIDYSDQGGYRVWTGVYAKGTGRVSTDVAEKYNGALTLTTIKYLNEDSGATPDGVLISTDTTIADGYTVITEVYADGEGQISEDISYELSPDQGTTGVTIYTIKYLSDPSTAVNPITPPGGTELITSSYDDQDGYRVWTGVYASGTGTIMTDTDVRSNGTLKVYRKIALNAAPSAPAATIGGTVTLIGAEVRNGSRVEGGTVVYTYTWAEGNGLVVDEQTISVTGHLVFYHRLAYGSAPATPSATIGGTVTLVATEVQQHAGYVSYDYRWVEADGQASIETSGREDGSIVADVTEFDVAAVTPADPLGSAYLVSLTQTPQNGYFVNKARYIKPPATITFKEQVGWTLPGFAAFDGTQLSLYPPVEQMLLADKEVSYGTSQDSTTPWSVTYYSTFNEVYIPTATGIPVTNQRGLGGYLATLQSVSGTDDVYNGVECDSFDAVLFDSVPTSRPTTEIVLRVNNEVYLTTYDGTVVYRRTVIRGTPLS